MKTGNIIILCCLFLKWYFFPLFFAFFPKCETDLYRYTRAGKMCEWFLVFFHIVRIEKSSEKRSYRRKAHINLYCEAVNRNRNQQQRHSPTTMRKSNISISQGNVQRSFVLVLCCVCCFPSKSH